MSYMRGWPWVLSSLAVETFPVPLHNEVPAKVESSAEVIVCKINHGELESRHKGPKINVPEIPQLCTLQAARAQKTPRPQRLTVHTRQVRNGSGATCDGPTRARSNQIIKRRHDQLRPPLFSRKKAS